MEDQAPVKKDYTRRKTNSFLTPYDNFDEEAESFLEGEPKYVLVYAPEGNIIETPCTKEVFELVGGTQVPVPSVGWLRLRRTSFSLRLNKEGVCVGVDAFPEAVLSEAGSGVIAESIADAKELKIYKHPSGAGYMVYEPCEGLTPQDSVAIIDAIITEDLEGIKRKLSKTESTSIVYARTEGDYIVFNLQGGGKTQGVQPKY